jgi:hypothetical protein
MTLASFRANLTNKSTSNYSKKTYLDQLDDVRELAHISEYSLDHNYISKIALFRFNKSKKCTFAYICVRKEYAAKLRI